MATVTRKKKEQRTSTSNRFEQARPGSSFSRISPEDIQKKAYELFRQRGGSHGSDWSDWFEAEKLLMGRR